jgi:hypothetical protein
MSRGDKRAREGNPEAAEKILLLRAKETSSIFAANATECCAAINELTFPDFYNRFHLSKK